MPKLTMPYLKLLYNLARKRTKKKSIAICGGGVMREEDYIRCLEIINQCKNNYTNGK